MNSKKSSRTSKHSVAAEVVGVILDSPLGQEVGSVLSTALRNILGVQEADRKYERLKVEAQEAAANYQHLKQEKQEKKEQKAQSPYKVLGVDVDAPQEVVRAAWHSLEKKYHPDSGTSPNPSKATRINVAYEQICQQKGWAK